MTKLATFGIKCGNCKERHLTSQEVRECYDAGKTTANRPANKPVDRPSPKQMKYLKALVAGKDIPEFTRKAIEETLSDLDSKKASGMISALEKFPWGGNRKAPRERAEDGMYRTESGAIYRVQTVPGSDYRVAKRLVVVDLGGGKSKGRFEREDRMVYRLRPEHRMTPEEAAKYGALYNFCIVCGRTLTHEDSIAAGIGPICAEKV